MHGSKYVTNQLMHRSQYMINTPICERCWLQSSSVHPHDEEQEAIWLQNPTVYKHNSFFKKKMIQGICLHKTFASSCIKWDGP